MAACLVCVIVGERWRAAGWRWTTGGWRTSPPHAAGSTPLLSGPYTPYRRQRQYNTPYRAAAQLAGPAVSNTGLSQPGFGANSG